MSKVENTRWQEFSQENFACISPCELESAGENES